jgi:hypothetical protein
MLFKLYGQGELVTQLWRLKQLEYTWLCALKQEYADFWEVTRAALDFALKAAGVEPSEAIRARRSVARESAARRAWTLLWTSGRPAPPATPQIPITSAGEAIGGVNSACRLTRVRIPRAGLSGRIFPFAGGRPIATDRIKLTASPEPSSESLVGNGPGTTCQTIGHSLEQFRNPEQFEANLRGRCTPSKPPDFVGLIAVVIRRWL